MAVWPDEETLRLLAELPRPAVPGVRWTRPEQWHVTLRFFGEADPAEAGAALGPALGGAPTAVTADMGPAPALLGRNVLQGPVRGLEALAGVVDSATPDIGRPPRPAPFRGHLTLARGRDPRDLRPLAGGTVSSRWAVPEVTLVSSVPARSGSTYEVVARWPLGGA